MTMQLRPHPSPLNVPTQDLQRCHDLLGAAAWRTLAGQRIFITGGTGFVGKWLLATLLDANEAFDLGCRITVLSRNPDSFLREWPAMVCRVDWVVGDVRDFPIGPGRHDVVVHAATDVVAQSSPLDVFSTCIDGTRRVLTLARACGASRLLLLSSGAVYGPLPSGMTHVQETHLGGPDTLSPRSAYGEGKRAAEWLAAEASAEGLSVGIARLFAAVGPHLPLDKHFAIGNFLRAAMANEDIVIQGDGTPYRSYLYAADMAAWLWAVLIRGQTGRAYNIGSNERLSIRSLAERICRVLTATSQITVQKQATPGSTPEQYVPDIVRAQSELTLAAPMALDDAITRTAHWHAVFNSHQSL